jgi:hypothetical protein
MTSSSWLGAAFHRGGLVVHTAVVHIHAIDDGIAKRSAALDDPPTHGTDVVMSRRLCQQLVNIEIERRDD